MSNDKIIFDKVQKVEIPLSQIKTLLLAAGCLIFVVASVWMWQSDHQPNRYPPLFLKAIAVAGFVFFGLGFIVAVKALFQKRHGLVIDGTGIIINSVFSRSTLIPWHVIIGFGPYKFNSTKLLAIYVDNPKELIAKEKGFKRWLMKSGYNMAGTPYLLSSNVLKVNFTELEHVLNVRLEQYKTNF
jgi:hypothetical protein